MRILFVLIAVFTMLAFIVPHSSRRPDAIQQVLGLAGGVDSAAKASGGILVVSVLAIGLSYLLKRFAERRQ